MHFAYMKYQHYYRVIKSREEGPYISILPNNFQKCTEVYV